VAFLKGRGFQPNVKMWLMWFSTTVVSDKFLEYDLRFWRLSSGRSWVLAQRHSKRPQVQSMGKGHGAAGELITAEIVVRAGMADGWVKPK
jgi:hypothetical protein